MSPSYIIKLGNRAYPQSCGFIANTPAQVEGYIASLRPTLGLDHAWVYESVNPSSRLVRGPDVEGQPSWRFDVCGVGDTLRESRFLGRKAA